VSDGPTVLVVDDEPELADLYGVWLRESYDVRTAYGGEEAIDTFESDADIDVALIDRLMPRTAGDELLSHVRSAGYDCRVSIVTAVEPDFDIIEMGFDEYLVKPVQRAELREVVEALAARSEYDERVQEFFSVASKRAALQARKDDDELEASDAYAALTAEFERLRAELQRTADRLRPRDFEVEMRKLSPAAGDD
jgi:DNA-binding response OmpR family regulator